MADKELKALLIYRIEGSDSGSVSTTVITKYDHASQIETHKGIDEEGGLYGGRDKKFADAVSKVIGSKPPGQISEAGTLGGFNAVEVGRHKVVYGADADGICK